MDTTFTAEMAKEEMARIGSEAAKAIAQFKAEFTEASKDKAAAKDLEAIKGKFEEFCDKHEEAIKNLADIAEKQGITINEMSRKNSIAQPQSLGDAIKSAITEKIEAFKAMKANKSAPGVTLKAAATMTTANILPTTGGAIPFSLATGNGGIIGIQRRKPFLREIIGAKPTSSMYEYWVEQVNPDGAVNNVAEAAAKPQIDTDFQERTAKVEKIAGWAKMSKEVLADVDGMRNFIEDEIQTLVELKLDQQLYSGTGTTPQLKGLTQWATTLSVAGTSFALGVDQANNYDVAIAAKSIQANSYFFEPNVMLINPIDYGMMQVLKTSQGEYIYPRWSTADGMEIAGMRVYANPGVTAGDFIIMDTTKLRLRMREEFVIDYGYENDDFTKNLVTVLGELRALLYLPTNYAGAVLKGTFATVKAAMETA